MALSLRQRQIDAVVRMLNLNTPVASGGTADEEVYKILLLDRFCRDIISPLLRVNDLRKHGITLHLMIDQDRQNIPDVPAVYFVQPSAGNMQRIALDASRSVYDKLHLNFTSSLPRPLLEDLAAGVLKSDSVHRVAKVYDQYLEFISLESGMFSLAQPQAYVELNDPTRPDKDVESAVASIVEGLFCVLVTLGVVPIIRCPNKGPAEMVARQLDARLRSHLSSPLNLFKDGSHVYQRPLLCLFDRNVDLAVAVQHSWAYRPLVHDVLGMRLNRVLVRQSGAKQRAAASTAYELDDSDQFWVTHATSEFPKAAGEVDNLLRKWTADKDELNKQPGVDIDEDDLMGANTKHLTAAMNAVPELVERKRLIDKHINIGGALLEEIKGRSLDHFHSLEEEMLARGTVDTRQVIDLLRSKGNSEDKLRLAVVHLLVADQPLPADLEAIEGALREGGVDAAAVHYIKQLKRLNQSITSAQGQGQGSKDDLLDWAGRFGQSIGQSMKNVTSRILASGRQLVVTRAVEALIEAKPVPEVEAFVMLDPRAAKGSSAPTGSGAQGRGPFKEAIVFMIGGGNYVEYGALQEFAQRQQPPRNIIYGCTEVVSGKEFLTQLAELGKKMGAGGRGVS